MSKINCRRQVLVSEIQASRNGQKVVEEKVVSRPGQEKNSMARSICSLLTHNYFLPFRPGCGLNDQTTSDRLLNANSDIKTQWLLQHVNRKNEIIS